MRKGLVILFIGAVLLAGCTRKSDAKNEAEKAVLDVLKAPSTAVFCEEEPKVEAIDNTWFTVDGCVDAENGFGAMIRSDYTVELYYSELDREWDVEDVNIWADDEEEDDY